MAFDYLASDFIGVTLYAKRVVKARTYAADTAPEYATYKYDDLVGIVSGFVERAGVVWWEFDYGYLKNYYVKHNEGFFRWSKDDNAILKKNAINRGADVSELDKAERNENLTAIGWNIAKAFGLAYVAKRVVDNTLPPKNKKDDDTKGIL